MAVAVVGIAIAWRLFGVDVGGLRLPARPERVRELDRPRPVPLPRVAQQVVVRRPERPAVHAIGGRVAAALWWFDRDVVDGTVNGDRPVTVEPGRGLRRIQTGRVQNYALGIAVGLIVMAGLVPRVVVGR